MITFTRYLYLKDEVEYSLLICILKNRREEAMFWFEELYESGITQTYFLIEFYFKYYFEVMPEYVEEIREATMLNIMGHLQRGGPLLLPLLFQREEIKGVGKEGGVRGALPSDEFSLFEKSMREKNLEELEYYLMELCDEMCLPYVLNLMCKFFDKGREKPLIQFSLQFIKDKRKVYFIFLKKWIYLETREKVVNNVEVEGIVGGEEGIVGEVRGAIPSWFGSVLQNGGGALPSAWKLLKQQCKYNIPLTEVRTYATKLERDVMTETELLYAFRTNWLFYAAACPLWKKRIEEYGGIKELENTEFFTMFDLEPDEQPREILYACLGIELK